MTTGDLIGSGISNPFGKPPMAVMQMNGVGVPTYPNPEDASVFPRLDGYWFQFGTHEGYPTYYGYGFSLPSVYPNPRYMIWWDAVGAIWTATAIQGEPFDPLYSPLAAGVSSPSARPIWTGGTDPTNVFDGSLFWNIDWPHNPVQYPYWYPVQCQSWFTAPAVILAFSGYASIYLTLRRTTTDVTTGDTTWVSTSPSATLTMTHVGAGTTGRIFMFHLDVGGLQWNSSGSFVPASVPVILVPDTGTGAVATLILGINSLQQPPYPLFSAVQVTGSSTPDVSGFYFWLPNQSEGYTWRRADNQYEIQTLGENGPDFGFFVYPVGGGFTLFYGSQTPVAGGSPTFPITLAAEYASGSAVLTRGL
jgi:hypothetical protein